MLKLWTFRQEIDKLRTIFKNSGYPKRFVDLCVKKILTQSFHKKEVILKASNDELICVLSFTGKKSLKLRTCLVNSIKRNLKFCKFKVLSNHQANWICYSIIEISFSKRSALTLFKGTSVVTARFGKTCCRVFTRAAEHMRISNFSASVKQLAVSDHVFQCNCSIDFDHFDILALMQIKTSSSGKLIDETWPAPAKQNHEVISVEAIWLRLLLIEFYRTQACYGNIEADEGCIWIRIVSVFKHI